MSTRWLENPNEDPNQFVLIFWSSHEYVIHHQSEDSYAHSNGLICPTRPQIMLTTELRMISIF